MIISYSYSYATIRKLSHTATIQFRKKKKKKKLINFIVIVLHKYNFQAKRRLALLHT